MGCGGSVEAAAALAAVPEQPSAAAQGGGGAAGASAGAGLAAGAGDALLAFTETLPWVAPVAFLIGAVVKSAHDADVMKADAIEFARTVQSVEAVVEEAAQNGTLKKAQQAVESLQRALEDGLAHCQRLQDQSLFAATLLGRRDATRFAEIHDGLHDAVRLVTLAASVKSASLMTAQFEQSERLASKLESLGGADAVVSDPALKAQLMDDMRASDKLLLSSIDSVKKEFSASEQRLAAQLEQQSEEARLGHEVMTKQIDKLTTMLHAVMAFKAEGKEGEEEHTPEEKAAEVSGEKVRDLMERTPMLGAAEAARLKVVRELGMDASTQPEQFKEWVGDAELRGVVREAIAEMGMGQAFIGSIDNSQQTLMAHEVWREGEVAGSCEGMAYPREMSGW